MKLQIGLRDGACWVFNLRSDPKSGTACPAPAPQHCASSSKQRCFTVATRHGAATLQSARQARPAPAITPRSAPPLAQVAGPVVAMAQPSSGPGGPGC